MVKYLEFESVQGFQITLKTPRNPSVSGYGRKIPTSGMVNYNGRWHRVYVMNYGNSGSAYIVSKGQELFLDIDTEYIYQGVTPNSWK